MAKSALMAMLRRAYAVARAALKTGIAPREIQFGLNRAASRRQFLHHSLIASVGSGFNLKTNLWANLRSLGLASVTPEFTASDRKVLIVGAGLAGLTTAYRLHQAGVPIDIVEASQQVGGRIRSLPNAAHTTRIVELGGEFIDSNHTYLRSLADELGLIAVDLQTLDTGLIPETWYFQGQLVSEATIVAAFIPLAQKIERDLAALGETNIDYRTRHPVALQLDQISLADYLDQADVDDLLKRVLKAAYVSEYGRDAEEQSCLNLLLMIGATGEAWNIYGDSDERYWIQGGNHRIPQQLALRLANWIQPGTVLEAIRLQADGQYAVTLQQGLNRRELTYDCVVLAIPFSLLRHVALQVDLPPSKQQAIAHLGYGTNAKLITQYRDRLWQTQYQSNAKVLTDLDFQSLWETGRYASGRTGWLTNYRGGSQGVALGQGTPEQQAQTFVQQLNQIFPGIDQVRVGPALRADWLAEPYVQGSYACYLVGQWTQIAGAEQARVGNLFFAGEHCAVEMQGYMEGACETAEQVALDILQDLGLSASAMQQQARITANEQARRRLVEQQQTITRKVLQSVSY